MDIASKLAGIIVAFLVAIVAVATVVAFFRANLARAQIEDLRGDRDDLQQRAERFEKELGEERTLRKELEAKVTILQEALTSKAQLDHLEEMLIAHDKRVDERHALATQNIQRVMTNQAGIMEQGEALLDSNKELQLALVSVLKGKS